MSHGCNQADRQASPRISSNRTSHSLSLSRDPDGHNPRTLSLHYSVAYLSTQYQSRACGVSLGTNRDRRLRHPALPEVWDPESGLDWTEASLLRHIRILIPFRLGSLAALVIVAIISSKKGRALSLAFAIHLHLHLHLRLSLS